MPSPHQFIGVAVALLSSWFAGCNSGSEPRAVAASASAPAATTRQHQPVPLAVASGVSVTQRTQPGAIAAPTAPRFNRARDAYVLLSGGGTPLTNNYSQYLQARAIAEFFQRECSPERTWMFFGAGNREGAAPVLADARREMKVDGFLVQSWVPGVLPRNRPATRDSFLRALREEILPLVREGGTLYLFIGDHGELAGKGDKQESAITMWQLKQRRARSRSWYTDNDEILGVAELRDVLASGLGEGRVVFGMTQCHGGGFHELGLTRDRAAPRAWFSGAPPASPIANGAGLRLRVAGFTATDQASPAAGCDADPDPERWAGYERFLPETLLGIDLMSGQAKGPSAASLAEAHEAATLVDHTIDKPRSTSEHYLESWARLIETELAKTLQVTPRVHEAVMTFERAVNSGRVDVTDFRMRARQEQFARFTQELTRQVPEARDLLLTGTRAQLDAAINGRERSGRGGGGRRRATSELRRAWTDTVRPAWKTAVHDGRVAGLDGPALVFEKHLLKLEDDGREFLFARGGNALLNEMYWSSGYATPARFERSKGEAVTRWGAERRARIVEWAKASNNPQLRAAGELIGPGPKFVEAPPEPMSRKTAAERVLFYRRVLAAWEFLIAMDAREALSELETLIELESLPVRPTPAHESGRASREV